MNVEYCDDCESCVCDSWLCVEKASEVGGVVAVSCELLLEGNCMMLNASAS